MKLFKKSFKLYVQSGTRKKMEAAINILINEQGGGCLETEDFKAKFLMLITEHYLRKNSLFFYLFALVLTHLTTFTEIQLTRKREGKSLLSCKG